MSEILSSRSSSSPSSKPGNVRDTLSSCLVPKTVVAPLLRGAWIKKRKYQANAIEKEHWNSECLNRFLLGAMFWGAPNPQSCQGTLWEMEQIQREGRAPEHPDPLEDPSRPVAPKTKSTTAGTEAESGRKDRTRRNIFLNYSYVLNKVFAFN